MIQVVKKNILLHEDSFDLLFQGLLAGEQLAHLETDLGIFV